MIGTFLVGLAYTLCALAVALVTGAVLVALGFNVSSIDVVPVDMLITGAFAWLVVAVGAIVCYGVGCIVQDRGL